MHQLQLDPVVLVNFLIDHQATIDGAVGGPGDYLVGPSVPLQDLVQAAGGTANWADKSGVELISTSVDGQTGRAETKRVNLPLRQSMLADYIVRPHDALRFNQVFTDVNVGNGDFARRSPLSRHLCHRAGRTFVRSADARRWAEQHSLSYLHGVPAQGGGGGGA